MGCAEGRAPLPVLLLPASKQAVVESAAIRGTNGAAKDLEMKVSMRLDGTSLASLAMDARRAEKLGYDYLASNETGHNPFLPLVVAAEHTQRIEIVTSIALAFPRSPMDMAYIAWDLQAQSCGRFILGLGSQVRGHIVRRFSTSWSPPAPRMREYILALRSIWDSWQNGTKLEFHGDYYSFNLMPPIFNPGPIEHPEIKVNVAAVNSGMLRVAGEVCDGVLLHSFNTPKYLEEVVLPNLEQGAAKSGRALKDLDISSGGFIVTGATEEELEANKRATRNRMAFYASTRVYSPVMRAHGWGDTAEKLYRMSVEGKWPQMGNEISDEMLEAFSVMGTYDDIVDKVKTEHGRYAGSVSFSIPVRSPSDEERLESMVRTLQAG